MSHHLSPEISRVLHDAFGDEPIENVAPVTGGRSGATLLSFTAAGQSYVLRQTHSARADNAALTAHEIECMQLASKLGVAPKLRHVDADACVSIMERIEVAPRTVPRDPHYVDRVASTLQKLHEGPLFPARMRSIEMLHSVEKALSQKGNARLPSDVTALMIEIASITQRYESASCHHDLNPGNILDTGERVYLVDWEVAGVGDPLFDLGLLGVFSFPTDEGRAALLRAYLARDPTDLERAHALVSRVLALAYYGCGFLAISILTGEQREEPGREEPAPLPISELLMLLSTARERASPGIVGSSLLHEMRREAATQAFASARNALQNKGI